MVDVMYLDLKRLCLRSLSKCAKISRHGSGVLLQTDNQWKGEEKWLLIDVQMEELEPQRFYIEA